MYRSIILATALAANVVRAQQVGTVMAEVHPTLTWSKCTAPGACTTQNGQVTIDANWRWTHNSQQINCYTGNTWNTTICPDDTTCAANCGVDGAEYASTYGVTTSGNALTLDFVTQTSSGPNVGSRLYLMDTNTHYAQFDLLNNEFTFDVDVSELPCGLNGALYFVSMDADGGVARFPANKAGAEYGTGYCDSQCPRDLKFIQGAANSDGWEPASNNINTGVGNFGSCCAEMDIWEANSMSTAVTPHPCTTPTQTKCTTSACGGTDSNATRFDSVCDPDGCDFNPFRQGNETFYGPGKTVDTTKVFTVVTQFIGNPLTAIKRFYVQNGVVIPNSESTIAGVTGNEVTEAYCDAQKAAFGDETSFQARGGMTAMSEALAGGMTLVMSLWDDYSADMLWLDSTFPTTKLTPGGPRGTCATTSGVPSQVEQQSPNSRVIYSNIKFGPINSTFTGTTGTPTPPSSPTPTPTGTGQVQEFGQCGGEDYTGPTVCVSPFTCQELNPFFFQCLTA